MRASTPLALHAQPRLIGAAAILFSCTLAVASAASAQEWVPAFEVSPSAHVVSPEVREMPEAAGRVTGANDIPVQHRPSFLPNEGPRATDPVLQANPGTTASPASGNSFEGVSFNGYYPPDANVSVGDDQIVQTTNVQFAIYSKTGALLKGPVDLRSLFANLGGLCSTTNGGDPVVLWDKIAKRWLISQLAFTSNFQSNYVCVGVSQTKDATGAFNLYAFSSPYLPDYPKFGVWSGSTAGTSDYYMSANLFSTALYFGPLVCAFNGSDLQNGLPARLKCLQSGISHYSLLPSDFDGPAPPAPGEPNYFVELGTGGGTANTSTTLLLTPFRATWGATSSTSTLTALSQKTLNVAAYALACGDGGACVPQAGTSKLVDSLGDRLMYRLAFRKFSGYESLVVNHSVDRGDAVAGVRWYEIRDSGGTTLANSPSVFQQGTYGGGDHRYRWMGSIAQDKDKNIAVGYSKSSAVDFPAISYAGRQSGDTAGQLGVEGDLFFGSGSETGGSRWGDYTSLSLDPVDDCTFWYTNEYFPAPSGGTTVAWRTRIASFSFPTCGPAKTATATVLFSSANPSSFGTSVTFTATVTPGAATGTVTFKDGATTLGSAAIAGGQAQYSTSSLSGGLHSITAVYGGDGSYNGSTSDPISQAINNTPTSTTLSSSLNPSLSGQTVTFTATVTAGATGSVSFYDGAALLANVSLSGNQAQYSTAALTIGTHPITAVYSGDAYFLTSTSAPVSQQVNSAPVGSFALSPTPASVTVARGQSGKVTISVTATDGFSGNVTLSASGVPPQSAASFSVNPVAAGGSSILTLTIGRNTPKKTYTVTVTGTGGGLTKTTTFTVVVQ